MSDDEIGDWKHLDVDLEYQEDLHNLHNDYPLAPERVKMGNVEKLIPNKTNYFVHYENLKLYESFGLKIAKIHRGIKFEESSLLEEYINLNTKLRIEDKQSGNNFDVDLFKLMHNYVFAKSLENIRNMVDIRLISSDKIAQKTSSHAKL